jgi:hypothetical protein
MAILPLRTAPIYVLAAEWLALTATLAPTADADPVLAISRSAGQIDATLCSETAMRRRERMLCCAWLRAMQRICQLPLSYFDSDASCDAGAHAHH